MLTKIRLNGFSTKFETPTLNKRKESRSQQETKRLNCWKCISQNITGKQTCAAEQGLQEMDIIFFILLSN
jgi:cytochrome c-type biogenesis protein CcmH/NrfF